MDYTHSDAHVTDVGTGNRMHQSSAPVTTAVEPDDMNMVIWSLMEIIKAAGLGGVAFDKDDPATYQRLLDALRVSFAGSTEVQGFVATAAHTTFAAALAAAANKTLRINSAVVIATDTTIPANVAVEVAKAGFVTVNAGVTLTIAGSFEAGAFQVFGGAGAVKFASSSRSRSPAIWFGGAPGAVYSTARQLVQNAGEPGGPVHAFEDNNVLNFTYPKGPNLNAYASFDANTVAIGAGAYDHLVAFQARQTYSGSDEIWSRWDSFNCLPTHNGTGAVRMMRGFHMENPLGGGQIDFLAGYFCQRLDRGAENYGFYSATPLNAVSVGAGESATWLLRGNGQAGGFGLAIQSTGDSSALVRNQANERLRFGTNNVDTMVCTSDGRWKMVGPGTTVADLMGAGIRLEASGTIAASFKSTGGAASAATLHWNNAAAGDNLFASFYTDASPTLRASIDYNRTAGQVRYNTTCDQTLKTLIGDAPVEQSLQLVDAIAGVLREFYWNDDTTKRPQIAPFAQELHKVMKGAVSVGGEYDEVIPEVTERRVVSEAKPASPILDAAGKPMEPAREAVWETVVLQEGRTERRYRPWAIDKTAPMWHVVAAEAHSRRRLDQVESENKALRSEQEALRAMVDDLVARVSKLEGGSGGAKR